MFLALVAVVLAGSPDGGASPVRTPLPSLLEDVLRAQRETRKERRTEELAALRSATAKATGAERPLLERMTRLLEQDEPLPNQVPELADILRSMSRLVRGRFDEERAVVGAFLSLPSLARSARLDPEPLRREGLAMTQDLVERFPAEGRAHGLRASAMMEARADAKAVLVELQRCAQLEPSAWCSRSAADLKATLERPRCSGSALKAELLATGAQQEWTRTPGATKGQWTDVRENEPFLRSADFSSISVDADGNLALEVTEAAKARLEKETRRLVGTAAGAVVLTLGGEVLLSARVQEPITEGRIRVSRGLDRPPFRIEDLCKTVERPTVP